MNGYAKWFQLLLGVLVTIALAFGGYAIAQIDSLKTVKLDKEQYYKDIHEIKAGINDLVSMHLRK